MLRTVGGTDHDKARALLVKLDELNQGGAALTPSKTTELPIEVLALNLDQVQAATNKLAEMEKALGSKLIAEPEAIDSDERQPASRITPLTALAALGTDLKQSLDHLNASMARKYDGLAVYRSLENLKAQVADLDDPALLALLNQESELSAQEVAELGSIAAGIAEGFQRLDTAAPGELSEREEIFEELKDLKEKSTEVSTFFRLPMRRIDEGWESAKKDIEEIKAAQSRLSREFTIATAPRMFEILAGIAEDIETLDDEIQKMGESKIGMASTKDQPVALANLVASLNNGVRDLELFLGEVDAEFQAVRSVTAPLTEMETAVAMLASYPVNPEIHSLVNGGSEPGGGTDEIYRESLQQAQNAIAAMTQALSELSAEGRIANLLVGDPEARQKATLILNDFEQFQRTQFPQSILAGMLDPQALAVASRERLDILIVLIAGAVGSMIFMVQYTLRMMLDGQSGNELLERPFSWYVFRPVFGAIVAFAMYLLYKTGQLALGAGGLAESLQSGINIPILSLLGLLTGLLCWQALEAIQSKGETWFRSATRKNLWATGLKQALDAKQQSAESCAQHVGCSIAQVDRWIEFRDQTTPEMQDRLTTWLDMQRSEIFTSLFPVSNRDADKEGRPKFAVGLAPYLARGGANLDEKAIALSLRLPQDMVERWRDQKEPVPPQYQWQLLELLGERYSEFFEEGPDLPLYWAVRLREQMEKSQLKAVEVAAMLGTAEESVRNWREMHSAVPKQTAVRLLTTLGRKEAEIFKRDYGNPSRGYVLDAGKFEAALLAKYPKLDPSLSDADHLRAMIASLEEDMDLAPGSVERWRNQSVLVYEPTAVAIARLLSARVSQFADLIEPP